LGQNPSSSAGHYNIGTMSEQQLKITLSGPSIIV
jgi:hypothetical protein